MNMIDEKDPGQELVKADSSDDELIIELTDEVIVDSKDDNGKSELVENLADDPQQALEEDKAAQVEEDEEIIALDATDESDLQEEEAIFDLVEPVAEEQDDISESQPGASEIGASRRRCSHRPRERWSRSTRKWQETHPCCARTHMGRGGS